MGDVSLAGQAQSALQMGHFTLTFVLVAAGGFLTALSPCVYPLIPITIAVFGARDTQSRLQAFSLATSYMLGMVLLYAVLGTAFASAGKVFGTLLANHYVVFGFAFFCALMAASMLGAFELRLPATLQTRLSVLGGHGYRGAFVMGLVSGLVAAPCTGPVLSVLLTFIASSQNLFLGFALMLAFGIGLGLPFLILATYSSSLKSLPKSGVWMEWVKSILAVVMIGLALYYAQFASTKLRVLLQYANKPTAGILVIVGLLLGAIHLSLHNTSLITRLRKISGAIIVATGGFLFFQAPEMYASTVANHVAWRTDEAAALAEAHKQHKPIIIDFFATWCAACLELDEKVYSQAPVIHDLERFIPLKIDGTDETDAVTALYKKYDIKGLPTVIFIDQNGKVLKSPRITGFTPAEEFLKTLQQVK